MPSSNIPEGVYDVLIIGGGPAGLTAGLYAARASLNVLLVEAAATLSQIAVTDLVENYPGIPEINGYELVDRFKKQAVGFGLKTAYGDVTSIEKMRIGDLEGWQVNAGAESYRTLAVIVATGANWRKLGAPGEAEFIGKGVSFCATCDGPFFKNKEVVVVGGGDTAVQEAVYLTRFVRKLTLVHRRDRLRAGATLRNRAVSNPKIEFAWNSVVSEIAGDDSVKRVRIKDVKSGKIAEVPADGVFIFIGLTPNTDFLRDIVERDRGGYILADGEMKTSARGIFACGDCIKKLLRQVVTACGDGATAAFSAEHYIEELKGEAYD
jgi:thioredoxin reductase (NADPH)